MKKFMLGAFLLAGILLLAIFAIWLYGGSKGQIQLYKTSEVKRGSLKASVSSTGQLVPLNTVKVGSQVSGIIKEIYVDFNDLVEKDQIESMVSKKDILDSIIREYKNRKVS